MKGRNSLPKRGRVVTRKGMSKIKRSRADRRKTMKRRDRAGKGPNSKR